MRKLQQILIVLLFASGIGTQVQAQPQATKFKNVYTINVRDDYDDPFMWAIDDSLLALYKEYYSSIMVDTIQILNSNHKVLYNVPVLRDISFYNTWPTRIINNCIYFVTKSNTYGKKKQDVVIMYQYNLATNTYTPITVPKSLFPKGDVYINFEILYVDEFTNAIYLFDFQQEMCVKYDLQNSNASFIKLPSLTHIKEAYVAQGNIFFCEYRYDYNFKSPQNKAYYVSMRSIAESNSTNLVYYDAIKTRDKLNAVRQADGSLQICLNDALYELGSKGLVSLKAAAPELQKHVNKLRRLQDSLYYPTQRGVVLVAGENSSKLDTLKLDYQLIKVLHIGNRQYVMCNEKVASDPNYVDPKSKAEQTEPAVVTSSDNTSATTAVSFPYSDDFFIKLMKQYVKERDDLYTSYNRYVNCIDGGKTRSDCEFYFPVGGKGRSQKLLADCNEYSALLDQFPDKFAELVGETVANSKTAMAFDKERIAQMIKVFR
ncbi:MAG: hypothetical protein RL660_2776 [Bacteroidota bacterium]|jgi:hypothetical protein